jgi:hypothetical protein
MPSLFEKLNQKRPQEPAALPAPTPLAAGKLLGWLQNSWTEPTITARQIYQYGPAATRDRESTLKLTEILVRQGVLVPMKAFRQDR